MVSEAGIKKNNSELQTPNSELPPGWRWVKLGEVCGKPEYGFTASAENKEVGPKFLRITDIQNGKVDWENVPYCKCHEIEKYLLKSGDILFARTGGTTGKSYLITEVPLQTIFASYLIRVSVGDDLVPEYLYLFFQSEMYWNQVNINKRGGAQPNMNATLLSNIFLPFPPLSEQQRIAAKIQELMQEVERARTACEKQLDAAKALPAAYLREVFESEEAKMWNKKRLNEICENIIGGGTPSRGHNKYWGGTIYWLSPSELDEDKLNFVNRTKETITEEGSRNSNAKIIPCRSVLLSCTASVGKVAINEVPLATNQQFNSFVLKNELALPEFLAYYLIYKRENIKEMGGKTTFTFISKDEIADLLISIPPLSVQEKLVLVIKEKIKHSENLQSAIRNQQSALDALPEAILRKAFRGES